MDYGVYRLLMPTELFYRHKRNEIVVHSVDEYVGKRIRYRRWIVGMTQQKLAENIGIKFQQIQKYETGLNRVSASRLWDISETLEVPVNFFFEGLERDKAEQSSLETFSFNLMENKEAIDLIRTYFLIPEKQRRKLFDLARVLSDVA